MWTSDEVSERLETLIKGIDDGSIELPQAHAATRAIKVYVQHMDGVIDVARRTKRMREGSPMVPGYIPVPAGPKGK